ncbi:protein disulfide oxidoreductase [Pseudidiomarina donghaiensis]|uniref:Protein disulfide oxidoreductase n=1 Tax=Pseudidiomarina donghaiensis TaxID=519452 RepID=A0A432XIA3_9GAMM|nr:protein disulfide oxidoreductase [Pseudidiomarina donghaiensis]RUO48356.1 protein disulfide oxidoreductase [Pseudidiomarina donghaiensis]SFV24317.1 AhpC/TSA family protein [Pseudidiomarina donghaiensis]
MKRIKQILLYVVLFLAISFAVDAWRGRHLPSGPIAPLTVTTLSEGTVDVLQLSHEQPVVLYFWGTWCPICELVSPSINWLAEDYSVFSIAIRSGDDTQLTQYLTTNNYQFETVNDSTGMLAQRWQIVATPTVTIIANGEIVSYTTGASTPVGLWLRLQWARLMH